MKHILHKFSIAIPILIVLVSLFYFFTYTQYGTYCTVKIAEKIIPGNLSCSGIHGKLLGQLDIKKISYKGSGIRVTVKDLKTVWNPFNLLFQKLIINELHISSLKIDIPNIDYEQIVEYIVQKNMFSQIKLQNLNLKNITINSNSKNSLKIKSVNLEDLYMKNNNLYNLNIDLKTANNHLKFTGSLFEKYNFKWNVNIKNLQEFSNYTGNIISKGNVTGNSKNLKVKGFLKISNLKFGSNEINGLKGKIDLDLSNNKISYVNTSAKQIRLNDYSIRAINLKTKIKKEKQNNEDLYLISTNINPFSVVILETYQNKVFNFKKSALKIVINPKNISSKLKLLLENQKNPINAKLNINENNEIKGQIKWNTNNLSFISTLVPEITKFKGQLNTKTNISGTLSNPVFQINATLKNASTNIPYLNLHLNNIEVVGIGNNNAIYYNSVIHSGKGILEVTGKTDFNYPLFQTNMNIEGDNFLSINTDTLKVISSPKVILYLNSDGLNVKGDVTIPRATIKSYKSNDIETLPNNVVFINNPSSLRELFVNNNNFQFNYDISFTLGNNVNIDTKNLIALMNGSIKVQTMPQGIIATGILRIVDGRYNAYGQSLTITKGNLIFTNSPITNPILDIIASRKFHSITTNDTIDGNENLVVGAHVKGTADNPQITLFSNPNNLSQKDILSYLAIGQPSDQLTGNKLDLLLRAVQAISFGNEIGNLSNGIRQKLGLSFNIQTLPYNDDTDKKLTSFSPYLLFAILAFSPLSFPSLYVIPAIFLSFLLSFCFSSFTLLLLLVIFFSLTFRHSHSSYFSLFSFLLLFVIHTPPTSHHFLFSYFSSFTLLLLLTIFFSLTFRHSHSSYFSLFSFLLLFVIHTPLTSLHFLFSYFSPFSFLLLFVIPASSPSFPRRRESSE